MRPLRSLLFIAALFVVNGPVLLSRAATSEDVETCKHGVGDGAIAACTRVIEAGGPDLASAYLARDDVYYDVKGDLDRAIADYTEVVRLDPKQVFAYFNRGSAYGDKEDYARAFADFAEVIKLDPLPRLPPSALTFGYDHLNVYYNRGLLYLVMGDLDHAIADYTEAIRLDPKYALVYDARGSVHFRKGDDDRAMADYNEAIRLDPKLAMAHFDRGLAYLYNENLAKALTDVVHASELDPTNAYFALWVDILGERSDIPSRISGALSRIDMTAWPAPVIRMFLGQITPAAALAAADNPDALKKRGQVCEVDFYSGEWALRQGAKGEATRLFTLTANSCNNGYTESAVAKRELKALGATP